jgi:3-oxoacyl-[acyl-carrier protein] reductase
MSRYFENVPEVSGRTAVVTGASNWIGAGIAKVLAADGASVVINYSSSKVRADRVVAEIRAKGGKAIAVEGDVAKFDDVKKIFAETKRTFGQLDILINNAGAYELLPIRQVRDEDFQRYFNVTVLGLLLATQEATHLFGTEGGSVFNIHSVVSDLKPQTSAYYTATKLAVDSVTRTLAKDLGANKIRVNSIEVVVQLVDQGLEPLPKGDAMEMAEEKLVEQLSKDIRFWALDFTGAMSILLRRPNAEAGRGRAD